MSTVKTVNGERSQDWLSEDRRNDLTVGKRNWQVLTAFLFWFFVLNKGLCMWLGTARAGSWDDGGVYYSHQLDSMEFLCKALWGHHTGLAVATVIPTVVTEKGVMTKALAKKFPGVGEVSAAAIVWWQLRWHWCHSRWRRMILLPNP